MSRRRWRPCCGRSPTGRLPPDTLSALRRLLHALPDEGSQGPAPGYRRRHGSDLTSVAGAPEDSRTRRHRGTAGAATCPRRGSPLAARARGDAGGRRRCAAAGRRSRGRSAFDSHPAAGDTRPGGPVAGGPALPTSSRVAGWAHIVFVGRTQNAFQLWLRRSATLPPGRFRGPRAARFRSGPPTAASSASSPAGKLKRVPIAGGPSQVLCAAPSGRGGSWSRDNVIVFCAPGMARRGAGLMRVSAAAGCRLRRDHARHGRRNPSPLAVLPARRAALPLHGVDRGSCCPPPQPAVIRIGVLDAGEVTTTLFEAESAVSYASGHLNLRRNETLMAAAFAVDSRQPIGEPFPVAEHVATEGSRYIAAWCRRMARWCTRPAAASWPEASRRGSTGLVARSAPLASRRPSSTWRCRPMDAGWLLPSAPATLATSTSGSSTCPERNRG